MKSKKQALLTSGLCLGLSAALLAGTTFAWFTDSVTNKGNTIQAGTLDVGFQFKDLVDLNDKYEDVPINATETGDLFTKGEDGQLWEPGYSYGYDFKVTNNGSLALKWELSFQNVKSTGGDNGAEIADVIDVYVGDADDASTEEMQLVDTLANLANGVVEIGDLAGKDGETVQSEEFSVVLKMNTEAGNDYKNANVTFDVYLRATQDTVETDGFGKKDYDSGAEYDDVIINSGNVQDDIANAVQNGGTVQLPSGMVNGNITVPTTGENVTIVGAEDGSTVINGFINFSGSSTSVAAVNALSTEGKTLTLENLTIKPTSGNMGVYFGNGNSNLTVKLENCTIIGTGDKFHGVSLQSGGSNNTLVVKDTKFVDMYCALGIADRSSTNTNLNNKVELSNVSYENVTYQYQMFYPAADSYFVDIADVIAKGAVERFENLFTVSGVEIVTAGEEAAANGAALQAAVDKGGIVYVTKGTYDVTYKGSHQSENHYLWIKNDNVTIIGEDGATITAKFTGTMNGNEQQTILVTGKNVTLKNLTVEPIDGYLNKTVELRDNAANVVIEGCTIEGNLYIGGPNVGKYTVKNNIFTEDTISIAVANGAGNAMATGEKAVISGNTCSGALYLTGTRNNNWDLNDLKVLPEITDNTFGSSTQTIGGTAYTHYIRVASKDASKLELEVEDIKTNNSFDGKSGADWTATDVEDNGTWYRFYN